MLKKFKVAKPKRKNCEILANNNRLVSQNLNIVKAI